MSYDIAHESQRTTGVITLEKERDQWMIASLGKIPISREGLSEYNQFVKDTGNILYPHMIRVPAIQHLIRSSRTYIPGISTIKGSRRLIYRFACIEGVDKCIISNTIRYMPLW